MTHTFFWHDYETFGINPRVDRPSQFAAIRTSSAATRLPGFTRVDAAAYYEVSDRVEVQLNIENLFDVGYFASAHNNNNITPGSPRAVKLTLSAAL